MSGNSQHLGSNSASSSLGNDASASEHSGPSEAVYTTTLSAHGGHAEEKVTAECKHTGACASLSCSSCIEKPSSRRRTLFRDTWVCHCKGKCPAELPAKGKGKGKGKKAKCPTRQKVKQIASTHLHTEMCFDDGDRAKKGEAFEWITIIPWMMMVLHKSRRLTHHLWIIDPETGELDGYLEPKLRMLTDSLQVVISLKSSGGPYSVLVQCPKDRGDCKECKMQIDSSVVVNGLALAVDNMSDGAPKDRLVQLQRRFESAIMQAILAFDKERCKEMEKYRYASPYREYTCCPRVGCTYCNGFRCNPKDRRLPNGRIGKIVRCPDPDCQQEGEPTWWCSLCDKKHLEHERCPLPDPREGMSPEDLAFHDKEVREGREQVCPCGAFHMKDAGCDSVHCPRRGCGRHICFGCGAEIGSGYTTAHMTVGPREHHPGTTHWGCRRTYARKAASNEDSEYRTEVRAWLLRSVNSKALMVEAQFVLTDPLRPLEEGEGKEWLADLIARAIEQGTL